MHCKHRPCVKTLGVTLATLLSCAHAAAADDREYYFGATLGAAFVVPRNYDVDTNRSADGHGSAGIFVGGRVAELGAGLKLPLYVEAGYQAIATHKLSYKVGNASSQLSASGRSVYIASKLDIPFTERFGAHLRLGLARNSVSGTTAAGAPPIAVTGSATGLLTGVGLHYDFASGLTARADLTSYGKASKNAAAGAINLGVSYRF